MKGSLLSLNTSEGTHISTCSPLHLQSVSYIKDHLCTHSLFPIISILRPWKSLSLGFCSQYLACAHRPSNTGAELASPTSLQAALLTGFNATERIKWGLQHLILYHQVLFFNWILELKLFLHWALLMACPCLSFLIQRKMLGTKISISNLSKLLYPAFNQCLFPLFWNQILHFFQMSMTILKQNKYPSFSIWLTDGNLVLGFHLWMCYCLSGMPQANPTAMSHPNPAQNAHLASANINYLLFIKKNHISPPFASLTASPRTKQKLQTEITKQKTDPKTEITSS